MSQMASQVKLIATIDGDGAANDGHDLPGSLESAKNFHRRAKQMNIP